MLRRSLWWPPSPLSLLTVLMLRGPQTSGELRANSERLYRFADIAAVEDLLEELADRFPPHAIKLARAPGAREARWAHLLCGEAQMTGGREPVASSDEDAVSVGELVALKFELSRQAAEISELRALVLRMAAELGLSPEPKA